MRRLVLGVMYWGLMTGLPSMAEQAPAEVYRPSALLKAIPVYLQRIDGRWSASLTGDLKDSATELVEISLSGTSARLMTKPLPEGKRQCLMKMKDRSEFGYLECNSAFCTVNKGSAAAATLLRGVLSLGILTATDASSGNTSFTVAIDQLALDAAVAESKALELAKEAAPVLEYRGLFTKASSSQQLRSFIATFENGFDPELLVSKAKNKLPAAIAFEEEQARQKAVVAAQQEEAFRQQKIQRQAEEEALTIFRARLKPGDRAATTCEIYRACQLVGMVIEMKPPLAYVQWDNAMLAGRWVRLENLFPSPR